MLSYLMYKSSNKLIKEKDLNLNNKIYSKYFGGADEVYMEKMSEFFSNISKTKFTLLGIQIFMGHLINLILIKTCF